MAPAQVGRWIHKQFRALTPDEQRLVFENLHHVPFNENYAALDRLWQRFELGEVGMFALPQPGGFAAATLYEVERLADGSLCFVSHATVAIGDGPRRLTDTDLPSLEALARNLGCGSICLVTTRPGLIQKLTQDHGWIVAEVTLRKVL